MSEVQFAKTFLQTLDKKPIKLAADYASDPRSYPSQSPYILPRQTHPFPRKTVPTGAQQAKQRNVTATLNPMRGGETVTISDLTLTSTVHDVKTQYAQISGQLQDKIKILLNKKPAADLKTLSDLGITGDNVEFTVMLMGGGATPSATTPAASSPTVEKSDPQKMEIDSQTPAPESEKAQAEAETKPEAQMGSADEILKSEEFWSDLRGFLGQRLRDDGHGEKLAGIFREAYGRQ